jgi:hypothetical protein
MKSKKIIEKKFKVKEMTIRRMKIKFNREKKPKDDEIIKKK